MKNQTGNTFVEVLFTAVFILIVAAVFSFNMIFRDDTYRSKGVSAVQQGGYKEINVIKTNYWFGSYFTGCADDSVAVHMRAKNVEGKDVHIIACMGQFFGKPTIRFE